jgi:hypothetical protein
MHGEGKAASLCLASPRRRSLRVLGDVPAGGTVWPSPRFVTPDRKVTSELMKWSRREHKSEARSPHVRQASRAAGHDSRPHQPEPNEPPRNQWPQGAAGGPATTVTRRAIGGLTPRVVRDQERRNRD